MKKTSALLLALIVILSASVLSSCGGGTVQSPEVTTEGSAVLDETDAVSESKEESMKNEKITIRVGSYNIANGREVDHDMQKLANDITNARLDIVGLQEVDRFASRSKFTDTVKVLSELTGLRYFAYTKTVNIAGDEGKYGQAGEYGTAILSRYPIKRTVNQRLESGSYEARMLGYAEIDVDGTVLGFFNTHLSFEDTEIRKKQLSFISKSIPSEGACFLTGDFNISSLNEYELLSKLGAVCSKTNYLETYEEGSCIDNIFYSKDIALLKAGVIKAGHSDHHLLYAEFILTPKK